LPGFTVDGEAEPQTETKLVSVPEPQPSEPEGFVRLFVNVGRREGAKPADIQALLETNAGITQADTGPIRVRDRMTFVSIREELLEKAVAALSGQVIGGRTVVAERARTRDR
jgi:ATP-dependent RNA helicase DeaD